MELFASLRHSRVNLPCSFFSILFKICLFDNFKVSNPLVAGLGKSSYQWCISPGTYDSVHLVQWRPRLTPMLGCLAGSFLITCVSTNLISPPVESFKVSPSRRKYTLWLSKAVWLHVLIIHFTCIYRIYCPWKYYTFQSRLKHVWTKNLQTENVETFKAKLSFSISDHCAYNLKALYIKNNNSNLPYFILHRAWFRDSSR